MTPAGGSGCSGEISWFTSQRLTLYRANICMFAKTSGFVGLVIILLACNEEKLFVIVRCYFMTIIFFCYKQNYSLIEWSLYVCVLYSNLFLKPIRQMDCHLADSDLCKLNANSICVYWEHTVYVEAIRKLTASWMK